MAPHELLRLGSWLLSVPLIAVLHEAGHALAAGPAGYRVTSFGIGHGKPLASWRHPSGAVIYLGRWIFSGGLCVAIPVDPVPERRWLYHSGGLIAQGLLALALWPLAATLPILEYAFWFNLLVVAWNLLPLKLGGYATDGWQLFSHLWRPAAAGQFFGGRQQVERVLRFEQQVGSPLGQTWCRLSLRWMDVVTGMDDDGWVADEVLLMAEPRIEALDAYTRAERHRVEGRSLAAIQVIQETRRAHGGDLGRLAADMLVVAEARSWLAQGEHRLARQALARIAGAEGVVARDALAVELGAALLEEDAEEVERAGLRLGELLSRPLLDAPEAVRTLWEAARLLKEQGRLESAETLASAARHQASALISQATPRDKVAVAARLGEVAGVEIQPPRRSSL